MIRDTWGEWAERTDPGLSVMRGVILNPVSPSVWLLLTSLRLKKAVIAPSP